MPTIHGKFFFCSRENAQHISDLGFAERVTGHLWSRAKFLSRCRRLALCQLGEGGRGRRSNGLSKSIPVPKIQTELLFYIDRAVPENWRVFQYSGRSRLKLVIQTFWAGTKKNSTLRHSYRNK